MKTMKDIYDLLKRSGIYIYTRDRKGDLILMEDEIRELFKARVIDTKEFQMAVLLLRQEAAKVESEEKNNN